MFKCPVDSEIDLLLLHQNMAHELCQLVDANRNYLTQWLPWVPTSTTASNYQAFIKHSLSQYAAGDAMVCGIVYQQKLVGIAGFNTIDRQLGRAELGYWLCASQQGKGIMTRTCRFLIDYAFTELDLHKVQLSAAVTNKPSRQVAKRLGLQLEGVITRAEKVGDEVVDHAVYGLLRP